MPSTAATAQLVRTVPRLDVDESQLPVGSVEQIGRGTIVPATTPFDVGDVAWFKIPLPFIRINGIGPQLTVPDGEFAVTIYTSDDPDEDGSTLTSRDTFTASSTDDPSDPHFYHPPTGESTPFLRIAWAYFKFERTSGSSVAISIDFSWYALGLNWYYNDGGSPSFAYGKVIAGKTVFAERSIDHFVGGTTVFIQGALAADDISQAADISADGTRLDGTASPVAWGPPMTHQDGELVITIGSSWSNTSWHKFRALVPMTLTLTDDDALARSAEIFIPAFGQSLTGTVMAVYTGPASAAYEDLTYVTAAYGAFDSDFHIGGAVLTVPITEPTWVYIQHAYVGDLDGGGADISSAPIQSMTWLASTGGPTEIVAEVDPIVGSTLVRSIGVLIDPIVSFTGIRCAPIVDYTPAIAIDEITGYTTVEIQPIVTEDVIGAVDPIAGYTAVSTKYAPDLGDNPPVRLQLNLRGRIEVGSPDGTLDSPLIQRRLTPLKLVNVPPMVIVDGLPVVPKWSSTIGFEATLIVGPNHIRAENPAPAWDGSGYVNPPPRTTKPMAARWVVDDLPDPNGGYYWLGDPSAKDGTRNIGAHKRLWKAHGSTPAAPPWRSMYPFKPSVREANHYLPGGSFVHHPKGVHFNPDFIEHMYLDFGGARRQPFTWVIAAMIVSFPGRHYRHYVLDAGRDPDKVRFPRISDGQTSTDRKIKDNLNYRTMLAMNDEHMIMTARNDEFSARTLRTEAFGNLAPRMMYGVFNGANSVVGHRSATGWRQTRGRIDNGANQQHRYYVLGRKQGIMSQDKAAHLLVFEIRFWSYALGKTELDDQYHQLASTYHFHKYRRL